MNFPIENKEIFRPVVTSKIKTTFLLEDFESSLFLSLISYHRKSSDLPPCLEVIGTFFIAFPLAIRIQTPLFILVHLQLKTSHTLLKARFGSKIKIKR